MSDKRNSSTDLYEEMEVALHIGAGAVRNLIAAIKGDDLGASHFTHEELTRIAVTLGEAFLADYDKLDAKLEGMK